MRYQELRQINVSEHIEKKNGLSYLSWSWALDQLLQLDDNAGWEYLEPKQFGESMMVFCKVTAFGKSRTAQLPVMDFNNRPIANPDAFSVNTAMQRCLAKAISFHGIGLYIYAGEDLPTSATIQAPKTSITPTAGALDAFNAKERDLLHQLSEEIEALILEGKLDLAHAQCESLTNEEKIGLWSLLSSKSRSALKKYKQHLSLAVDQSIKV